MIITKKNGDSLIMRIKQLKPKMIWKKNVANSFYCCRIDYCGVVLECFTYSESVSHKKAFEGGMFVQSNNYKNALKETRIVKDINYDSKFPDGTLDIIYPKNFTGKTSVIFWVHGGGFVGGDKSDITGYAVELAARGYTVININYALAPKRKYPTPVLQLGEAYEYIKANAKKYNVKLDDLYFAGDSAGAQISGQFVTIQTSPDYAKLTELTLLLLLLQLKVYCYFAARIICLH